MWLSPERIPEGRRAPCFLFSTGIYSFIVFIMGVLIYCFCKSTNKCPSWTKVGLSFDPYLPLWFILKGPETREWPDWVACSLSPPIHPRPPSLLPKATTWAMRSLCFCMRSFRSSWSSSMRFRRSALSNCSRYSCSSTWQSRTRAGEVGGGGRGSAGGRGWWAAGRLARGCVRWVNIYLKGRPQLCQRLLWVCHACVHTRQACGWLYECSMCTWMDL